jgi:hypothetical protein
MTYSTYIIALMAIAGTAGAAINEAISDGGPAEQEAAAARPARLRDEIRVGVTGSQEQDDFFRAVTVPRTRPARQVDAISGYVRNDFAGGDGNHGNGVAGFFMAVNNADHAQIWGNNLIVVDDPDTNTTHRHVGRTLIGSEIDFANTSPGTRIAGIGLTGSSRVQPVYASGFSVGTLSSQAPGKARWDVAFASTDGSVLSTGSALSIGKLNVSDPAKPVANPSQALSWSYDDKKGTPQNYRAAVAPNGNLLFTGTSAATIYNFDRQVYAEGPIVSNGYMRTTPTTFKALTTSVDPSPQIGDRAFITDATVCSFNVTVSGGGKLRCPVVFSGNWVAG